MQRLTAAATVVTQGVPAWAQGPAPLWAVALEGGRRSCHIMVPVQGELQPALVVFKAGCSESMYCHMMEMYITQKLLPGFCATHTHKRHLLLFSIPHVSLSTIMESALRMRPQSVVLSSACPPHPLPSVSPRPFCLQRWWQQPRRRAVALLSLTASQR